MERCTRNLNKAVKKHSSHFPVDSPLQTGHMSSNKKVGQGEQFRKTRGAMRREGNQKQLCSLTTNHCPKGSGSRSRKKRRMS